MIISIAIILDLVIMHFQDKQILINAIYLLRNTISELPSMNSSHKFNTKEEEAKYDLWIHYKLLAPWSKEGNDNASLKLELSLYLVSPLTSLKDDSLKKWRIKILYTSYKDIIYLIVQTSTKVLVNYNGSSKKIVFKDANAVTQTDWPKKD